MNQQTQIYLPLQFQQVFEVIQRLSSSEKQVILSYLLKQPEQDKIETHFASQTTLAKDWLSKTEDEAWADL